jgi:hypothetical protein
MVLSVPHEALVVLLDRNDFHPGPVMRMTITIMAMAVIYRNLLIVRLVKVTSLFVTNAFVILTGALFRLHTKENF